MHSAPSVSYPVGRSRFVGALGLAGCLLGAVATALWWVQAQPPAERLAAVGAVLAGAALLALWNWSRTASGVLSWDGAHWNWAGQQAAPQALDLQVCLDFQSGLLLRGLGDLGPQWLWLERASRPDRWDDLRRAVYSRAQLEAPGAAHPPAAQP